MKRFTFTASPGRPKKAKLKGAITQYLENARDLRQARSTADEMFVGAAAATALLASRHVAAARNSLESLVAGAGAAGDEDLIATALDGMAAASELLEQIQRWSRCV
jgi:hypothetical protein